MRIVIVGAGGIGAILGASLAKAGNEVVFVARGRHLEAMRAAGLRVEGERGVTVIKPVRATSDMAGLEPADLVLFCVKLWDVESAGAQLGPVLGPATAVLPLQNGIDASERLAAIIGEGHVLGGVALVTGSIVAPGVVRQSGTHNRVTLGELEGPVTPRIARLRDVLAAAGIDALAAADIQRERWEKFVGLVAVSGICALARSSIGPLRDDPDIAPLIEEAMREAVAVAQAAGVGLPASVIEPWRAFLRNVPAGWTPSMAVDIMAGNRLELPWLAGKVVELGRKLGVATPVNRIVHAALKPHVMGRAAG